jgi:hypothetical protein
MRRIPERRIFWFAGHNPCNALLRSRVKTISVDCYAGYRGEESPVRFRLGDRVVEVIEIVDRWLAPDHRYFKVRAADGIYILRNDIGSGQWELTLFESRRDPPIG